MHDSRSRCVASILLLVAAGLLGCTRPPDPTVPAPVTSRATPPGEVGHRAAHTATNLTDDVALVVGGCVVDGCTTATADSFLLTSSGATRTGSLLDPRDAHTAVATADGQVLVTGGFSGEGRPPLASAELYDPDTGTWAATDPLLTARGGHAAARLGRSAILVAGGWTGPGRYTATTEIFADGAFTAGPDLPVAVDGLAAATLLDGSVLITGGQTAPGVATTSATLVTPDGESRPVGPLAQARFKHAAVTLPDGRILVVGGTSDDVELLRSTEIYDPSTRVFTSGPDLAVGRYKLAGGLAVTASGTVVVAGGGPGVELVDPAGPGSRLLDQGVARNSFSTVSVLGATVRVVGGYDDRIRLTGADLFLAVTG